MTPKQLAVLEYVEDFQGKRGYAPTLQEIADHLRVTKVTVLSHLRGLEKLKRIRRPYYRRRGIEVVSPSRGKLPVLGRIVAGRPLEAVAAPSDLDLFATLKGGREYFALEVKGDSMIEDQIREGDFVICERRSVPRDGETVVALLEDGSATLKRIYKEEGRIRLQPANRSVAPILVEKVAVQGVVVGVYRRM